MDFIQAVYFESKSDRVLIYVIYCSDCFKVQGHLVPRLPCREHDALITSAVVENMSTNNHLL